MCRMLKYFALACLLVLGGCVGTRALMPVPTLYATHQKVLFDRLPSELQGNTVDLLYVTDRVPYKDKRNRLMYSAGRSTSLAFGSAIVLLGDGADAGTPLTVDSFPIKRFGNSQVVLKSLREIGRYPSTPYPFILHKDKFAVDQSVSSEAEKADNFLESEVNRRLALTPRKDVFLFIHGADNSLEFALQTWAGMWHFLGREGVPVVYSWPAGSGGVPLTSYNHDRESGEFTIFHLKQFLKKLASNSQVERIHIIAHSRGSDVITTAIRELFIESRASNENMLQRYKLANLLLMAPDLDMEVVGQRLAAERLSEGVGYVTIYVSPDDKALGLASVLFNSVLRFGRIKTTNVPEQVKIGDHINNIAFIEASQTPGLGHGYFYNNPAVSSDIILLLRYSLQAGSPGRPLIYVRPNSWKIPDAYLKQ